MVLSLDEWYERKKKEEEELKALDEWYNAKKSAQGESSTKGGNKDSVFKSGGFSDGVDSVGDFFGDLGETVIGTVGDLGLNVVKGAGRLVEGLGDLATYGVAGVADLFGADEFAEKAKNAAKRNTVDDLTQGLEDKIDQNSILGDKADMVSEGLGQVAGIILTGGAGAAGGLGTVGSTVLTTGVTGLSGMGSGMSEAYLGGATDEEAFKYGLLSGITEAGTELLFGGLGKASRAIGVGKSAIPLDDILARSATKGITNRVAKNLTEFGIKASAEGVEEVIAGYLSAHAKKGTYMSEKDFSDILKDENLLEQFVVAMVTSGIAQSGVVPGMKNGSLIESNKAGRDFITGYTQNEQTVVDKEVERRVSEQEKDGKKLSKREIGKIEEQVQSDLEKGYISTDTIEEVLGGETYKAYKDAADNEKALKEEYDELRRMKKGEMNDIQQDRLAELKAMNLEGSTKSSQLKAKLDSEISKLVKDSRLAESYNEQARQSQRFEADLSQYSEKQRKIVQKAIDSSILNNTNRAHELVDLVAKVGADKGLDFDFADNAKLKESGFALEGVTVNGFLNDGSVTVNVSSAKALNSVVGHEIAHVLEGTELYSSLQSELKSYLGDAEYSKRLAAIKETYKNVYKGEDADLRFEQELTADLVGDLLFTDSDFVYKLSTQNRNVFQKLFDEIKYLCKVATAGTKEARQLEKIKKTFEDAYRESNKAQKNTATEDGVRYSLNQNAESELHKALYDKNYQGEVRLRDESPAIMLAQKGVKNLPMSMKVSHIRENVFTEAEARKLGLKVNERTHYHGLGEKFYLQIIDGLDNVKEAYRGTKNADDPTRREKYFLLVSEFVDKDGNTINVPVYIDEHAMVNRVFIDVNKISTVFGKENFRDYINRQVQNKNLVRIKNRSNQTSESNALIARDYGEEASNSSILNPDENVNGKTSLSSKNEDIAYGHDETADKMSMRSVVEETPDLLAMHNITPDLLVGVINRGNLIMPSVAITNKGLDSFGEISLVFNKNSIDPNVDGANKLYGADAWTPTQTAIKKNAKFDADKTVKTVDSLKKIIGSEYSSQLLDISSQQFKEAIAKADGNIYEAYAHDIGIQTAYALKEGLIDKIPQVDGSVDKVSLQKQLNSKLDIDDVWRQYKRWLNGISDDIIMSYDNATNAEILNKMKAQPESAKRFRLFSNGKLTVPAVKYDSVDTVRQNKSRLSVDADMQAEVVAKEMLSWAENIGSNLNVENSTVIDAINEAFEHRYSAEKIAQSFKDNGVNISEKAASQLQDMYKKAVELPTRYFEAKPSRMVDLNEIAMAVIPDNTSAELKKALTGNGIQFIEYQNGNEKSRLDTLNSLDDLKFSLSNISYSEFPVKNGIYGKDVALRQKPLAPVREDISKAETVSKTENVQKTLAPVREDIKPTTSKTASKDLAPVADKWKKKEQTPKASEQEKVAEVLDIEPETPKKSNRLWSKFVTNFVDKGAVFEKLSLKTNNRELMGKWNYMLSSDARAQRLIGDGADGVKSLNAIREEVEKTGKTKEFYSYMYHQHNIDRMSREARAGEAINDIIKSLGGYNDSQIEALSRKRITDKTSEADAELILKAQELIRLSKVKNKAVFGDVVTAQVSQGVVQELETKNPEFKRLSKDVYDYMNHLRKMMVDKGLISQETADLWSKIYPHYVPVRRVGDTGLNINVPLDTGRTGVNAPIKAATGGNSNILPLFDTMAQRTLQTFKAIDKNRFGVELKNTLDSSISNEAASVDDAIDSVDTHEDLLQEGKNGRNPTFTVFENGERVTFEITEDMYDALRPTSSTMAATFKPANFVNNLRRGMLTEYNPTFMATNAIKDMQDVLVNSQHPAATYKNMFKAVSELAKKGKWYTEYMENGGEQNTYFDKQSNAFEKEKGALRKALGFPLDKISEANNFIERVPRLAEYIASRETGASVEVAMLDAARVTTNFAAGGDVTKFFNRNGATFLNASVQGFNQQVRNIREAKANGLKGWLQLATKYAIAGLPAILLNSLLWDDDEDYEELSDYVKDNYYIVGKFGDGNFVRIPKGRTLAVIQDGLEQIGNTLTGDPKTDWGNFFDLFMSNLAPNDPLDNNIVSPIVQVAKNETWYGEDLVPSRLQDLPAAEQFDESTDSISKWLGEKTNFSPVKINYLLDQYSGGLGDVVLPMLTPEAEGGDNSFLGNILAPMKDKFTTDSVMNNQNISDFYDTMDELTTNAKRSAATDEDILKNKYFNSVNADLSELYKLKREIQNSSLADDEKYSKVRALQREIDDIAKNALSSYHNVSIYDGYATVADQHYKINNDGEWQKLSDSQVEKLEIFGKVVGGNAAYINYTSELNSIKSDKDQNGDTISGSRKKKVLKYINSLDADYGEKIILYKSQYAGDHTYNYDIVDYLNSRSDISYAEMKTILEELGFKVLSDGSVRW